MTGKNSLHAAALLLTAAALLCAVSCGSEAAEKPADTTEALHTETQENSTETETRYTAKIPEGTDLGGKPFRIMVYNEDNPVWYDVDFNAVEETGETINDAVFQRTRAAEEQLHFKLERYPVADYGKTALSTSVQAADDAYDAGFVYTRGVFPLAEEGMLLDMNEVPGLQLDAPWWDQNERTQLSVAGKLFMLTGDISIMYRKSLRVVYYNKALAADYDVVNPYELIDNGRWTLEAFLSMCRNVSKDLDGDGKMGAADQYGLVYSVDTITLGLVASDVKFADKDADDLPVLSLYNTRTMDVWNKYTSILFDTSIAANCTHENWNGTDMFAQNLGLFACIELHNTEKLRGMVSDFGILPMPKYDEAQKDYHVTINPHCAAMLVIPVTNSDPAKTALVLDVLGAESKNTLTPAYYDVYLKGKSARDDESQVSLDIIFNSIRYDIGYCYDWAGYASLPLRLITDLNPNFVSEYEKIAKDAEAQMQTTIDSFLG